MEPCFSEAEQTARDQQLSLKDDIEKAKIKTEHDTVTASMEIARLKDELLESRRVTRGEEVFVEKLEVLIKHKKALFKRIERPLQNSAFFATSFSYNHSTSLGETAKSQ